MLLLPLALTLPVRHVRRPVACSALRGGFQLTDVFFTDAAFVAGVMAPVVRSELAMRWLSLASSTLFLTSGLWNWPRVNWVAVAAQVFFISRGLAVLRRMLGERRVAFTPREIRVYHDNFEELKLHEYRALLDAGARLVEASKGQVLVEEGAPDHGFMLLTKGRCFVKRGTRHIDTLEAGDCFGDCLSIAAMTKTTNATASVVADADVEYVCWDTACLVQTMARRITVRAAVLGVVAKDEARRILRLDWDEVRDTSWTQIPAVVADAVVSTLEDVAGHDAQAEAQGHLLAASCVAAGETPAATTTPPPPANF